MDGYRFSTEVTVRFAETDAQRVAHHSVFLVWFEVARIDYLARFRGGYRAVQQEGCEVLTTAAHVRYLRPVGFDDRLTIHARCVECRGARFRFEYVVEANGETVADGWTGHGAIDASTFRPIRVPAWLVEAIAAAEEPALSP